MDLFSFLVGVASALAVVAVLLALLRGTPRFSALPGPSLPIAAGLVIVLGALLGAWRALAPSPTPAAVVRASTPATPATAASGASPAASPAASMDSAIASLEARLARGGGAADDWELLAKSFEFLGRPADAAKARAHQLPALPVDAPSLTAALGRGSSATMPGAGAAALAPGSSTTGAPVAGTPRVPTLVLSPESTQLLARANAARHAKNPQAAAAIYAQLGARDQLDADG